MDIRDIAEETRLNGKSIQFTCRQPVTLPTHSGVLVVVEGQNDIEFLKRISRILNAESWTIADLAQLEQAGRLAFIPIGGGALEHWSSRLAVLGWKEFHLYDREAPSDSPPRERAAQVINARRHARAVITNKRALENYLHPDAIREALGVDVTFGDRDDVADVVAESLRPVGSAWHALPRRAQRRLRYKIKKVLNSVAVDRMTANRLAQRDEAGELVGWLAMISQMAGVG